MKKIFASCITVLLICVFIAPAACAKELKIGYVDLRRAFYEYEKSKTFDAELNEITTERSGKRTEMVEGIRKMREEIELLRDKAKAKKQEEMDARVTEVNEFDRETRQEILTKRNDMFREVIEDIQRIVEDMGKEGNYDYVLDSRNIMYGDKAFDLTDEVLKELNK